MKLWQISMEQYLQKEENRMKNKNLVKNKTHKILFAL